MITWSKRTVGHLRKEMQLAIIARRAQAFLASFPKSGRTWLRFILANYLNITHDLGLHLDLSNMFAVIPNHALDSRRGFDAWRTTGGQHGIPLVVASHEPYSRYHFWRRPVIFVVRDVRDVMVSAYFHYTRHKRKFEGQVSDFIRDPVYGLESYIRYFNGWAEGLSHHSSFVISYEGLKANPRDITAKCLEFLGWAVDDEVLERAVAASTFDAMRALELATGIPDHDYDRSDRDSLRVRRGKVGDYRTVLSADDVAWIQKLCATELRPAALSLLMRANTPIGSELGRLNERMARLRLQGA
jgi:hypothetical protein